MADVFDEIDENTRSIDLSAEQEAELARRLAGPDDYASDDEAKAFFGPPRKMKVIWRRAALRDLMKSGITIRKRQSGCGGAPRKAHP